LTVLEDTKTNQKYVLQQYIKSAKHNRPSFFNHGLSRDTGILSSKSHKNFECNCSKI